MTTCSRVPRMPLVAAVLGSLAMLATMLAAPAGAQLEDGTCPSSVDTVDEGWICSMLILDTPTDAPTDAQIALWMDVLGERGRLAVTDGIVFSDTSVESKVTTLYETQLGRSPDPGGLAHWRDRMQDARTELAVEFAIFGSREYLSRFASVEAFVDDQYQYYLGREAGSSEQAHWADLHAAGEASHRTITSRIARSTEAGIVRARILYQDYARRAPDQGGLQTWTRVAANVGLFPSIASFARYPEMVNTLGRIGLDLAAGSPDSDPDQDYLVAPQEVVTTSVGEPVEISVSQRFGDEPFTGPVDLTLFPCDNVTATQSPVTFADADNDGFADGIASTAGDQAYISTVNGEPTGGRTTYVADAMPPDDDILRFDVIAGPNPDCAVIVVFENRAFERELRVDAQGHALDPFGVTQVIWE